MEPGEGPTPTKRELENRLKLVHDELKNKPVIHKIPEDTEGIICEMRCSYCKQIVPAPIQAACKVGHLICADCLKHAPFCSWEPRGSRDARNMCRHWFIGSKQPFYDYIYNKSTFHCAYVSRGCTVKPKGTLWKEHCEKCLYKPPPCSTTPGASGKGFFIGHSGKPDLVLLKQ